MAEAVQRLWLENRLSASQIAARFGVSRNAIIGKMHRLGLRGMRKPNRHPAASTKPRPALQPQQHGAAALAPEPLPADDEQLLRDFLGIKLLDLAPAQCRYPAGDRVPYLFCGQPVQDGSSYCSGHHDLCRTPTQTRQWPGFMYRTSNGR